MSKRVADKYITDQNWDQDDGPNEDDGKGEFRRAAADILKNRVIRKARRRAPAAGQQGVVKSAFSGFSGLKTDTKAFGGFSMKGDTGPGASATATFGLSQSKPDEPVVPSAKSSDEDDMARKTEYHVHLRALNRSVSNWIKDHVDKNPLCDLTPIFNDYKKYLAEIDEKYERNSAEGSQTSKSTSSDSQDNASPASSQVSLNTETSDKPKFSLTGFGSKTNSQENNVVVPPAEEPNVPSTKSTFMGFTVTTGAGVASGSPFKGFGQNNLSKPTTTFGGFSFSSSMVSGKKDEGSQQPSSQADEEEYVPPKPESNVIEEEDAFYSIRCKLYYKKGESYADRGVGQLYLKPSGAKTQLLIRADTAISQVLLNILISSGTPIQKQGKNNIMIMCIPNPPINEKEKDKVVAMLIRVKSKEEADHLCGLMEEKKTEATEN